MNAFNSYLIIIYNITFWLGLNSQPVTYKLYSNNNNKRHEIKSNSSYDETAYLLESYQTTDQSFSLIRCISLVSRQICNKAISYQVNDDFTIDCKSYSSLNIQPTAKAIIYLRNEIQKCGCRYFLGRERYAIQEIYQFLFFA